jgi:hypothetical protein
VRGQRRLVIDANVARSSGETEHPASGKCREFLDATTEFGHRVVMTAEIQQEWRTHASRYASRWLTRMYARRRVYRSTVGRDDQLRRRVALVCCRVLPISIWWKPPMPRTGWLLLRMSAHAQRSEEPPDG